MFFAQSRCRFLEFGQVCFGFGDFDAELFDFLRGGFEPFGESYCALFFGGGFPVEIFDLSEN